MGYECPVCGVDEADGEHLANHLAFTALVRGGDHEAWLDDTVPDWEDRDPESLAPDVTPHAEETDTETVTEPHGREMPAVEQHGDADLSGEAAAILDEAQDITEQLHESSLASPDSEDGDDDSETQ
ncbi:DUF5810 domain-containing protein [Halobacterium noricense]|uniref:DUF5810 domain-containing protein n=1 Tax=Halobacterium noricense TaxID=223182 RepID=UPI001E599B69|nr:DUF5810 domain-containing protein [Halobacterium noricense]UHH25232.1 DUF5810 domain-containing protein [Halobacterium noricense]